MDRWEDDGGATLPVTEVCPNCGEELQFIKMKFVCTSCGFIEPCCEGGDCG